MQNANTNFVEHPWINPDTIERREYQEDIVKTALNANTLCVIPTGLGKTNIAVLVTAHRLESYPDMKTLFLAPTRPLVNQHKKTFDKFLKTGLELKVITGFNKPEERKELYKADIIFSTPQTIRNDLKRGIINLSDYSLLIIDEAHRAVGNYAYPYVAKTYILQSKNPLILALTASPGSFRDKINEVKQRLFIKSVEIRTREDSDVKPYVQELKQSWVEVELLPEMREMKKLLEKLKEERINKLMEWKVIFSPMISKSQMIRKQAELAKRRTGMSFAAMSLLAGVLKLDHALTLLETQCLYSLKKYFENLSEQESRAVSRLMKDENFNSVMKMTDELIKHEKEHPKIEKLKEIIRAELKENKYCNIIIFVQFRDTISRIMQALKDIPLAAPIEFIGQTKKRGKGLSQKEQIQILNEFRLGFYNILLATQIGEEGLDIEETSAVIFYEPIPSAIRKIQRTGRTARTKPGKVIVLMTKDTRDEAYHWSSYHKEVKMKKMLYSMKKQKEISEFSDSSQK
jgi:Fanconi anemia group M protein